MIRKILAIITALSCIITAASCTFSGIDVTTQSNQTTEFSLQAIPEFSGQPYTEVNNNIPWFSSVYLTDSSFEEYSPLDELGRCGPAFANLGLDTMPTEERGNIGMVKPTGWVTSKYDFVDGKYLYNRCHLIGYQLSGENANELNLITGTRYMNTEGMLPFENEVAGYIKDTGNHVLYRVTPIFVNEELLARGVNIEAQSVEDAGSGVCFNVYCYNVQPGVDIDYATGENKLAVTSEQAEDTERQEFILNTRSKKYHLPTCDGVADMSEKNKQEFYGTEEELISQGYSPCGVCIGD